MAGMLYGTYSSNRLYKASATSTWPIICNGNPTYAGAPARDEDPRFPLENLFSPDRYAVWATTSPSATGCFVQVDLSGGSIAAGAGGSDKTLNALGVLNMRGNAGSIPPTTINLGYRTRAQGYASATNAYSTVASFSTGQQRDNVLQLSQFSARYLQFEIPYYSSEGFTLGLLYAGLLTDLGQWWSADGYDFTLDHNVTRVRAGGGAIWQVPRGDYYARARMEFRGVPTTVKAQLQNMVWPTGARWPVTIVDELGTARQWHANGGAEVRSTFGGLYDVVCELEQAP